MRRRLMVALDMQSLGRSMRELDDIDRRVIGAVVERYGNDCEEEIYRLYPQDSPRVSAEWLHRHRSEAGVKQWRRPRHRGRRPPGDWDYQISRDALDWCIRDAQARPAETIYVLVTAGGHFGPMLRELCSAGVEILLLVVDQDKSRMDGLLANVQEIAL